MKKYIYVYEKLKKEITSKKYKYGAKLPSKRSIAENLGVSVITCEQALDILISEGYIISKERSGYYVSYRDDLYGNVASVTKQGLSTQLSGTTQGLSTQLSGTTQAEPSEDVQVEAVNRTDYFPLTPYTRAIRKILNDKGEKIAEKSPNLGITELRKAISEYLFRNRGIDVGIERIIIGAGAEYLYGTFAEVLRGRKFAIETPGYDKIERVYTSRGVDVEKLQLSKNGISSELLRKSNASVLHITPFQSYPTGISIDVSKKREYLDFAIQRDGYIIEDDYSSEFSVTAKLADTIFAIDKTDSVIYINSFSKTVFPSIRIAYAVIPEKLLSVYLERAGFYSCPVPVLDQYVITELLENGSFERHINKIRRQNRTNNRP